MFYQNRKARINVKLIVILMLVVVALGISLVAARQIRRAILSERDLKAGNTALEKGDWPEAYKHLQEYLGRHPDDVDILEKYAKASLSIRPIEGPNIMQGIAAYRRVLQLEPQNDDIYDELAKLYAFTGNFEEVAYIADMRLEHAPNDRQAPLWLAEALIRLKKMQEARTTLEKYIEVLPKQSNEYVRACGLMSSIAGNDNIPGSKATALEYLNKGVKYMPGSAEALVNRARFLRITPDISGFSDEERQANARKDLESADRLRMEDPKILLFLGVEWMMHNALDRAETERVAMYNLPKETIEEHFFDVSDWIVAKFLFASDLAIRRGAAMEGAVLADEALTELMEERHRIQALPSAIPLYVAAGKISQTRISQARSCLDEYLKVILTHQELAGSRLRLGWLTALVARAEKNPYAVIDALQTIVATDASDPRLVGLLAEAYSQTNQFRRAVVVLREYLRNRPDDPRMTLQLAKEYAKLKDWSKAFEAAQMAESLDPTDIETKLVRIEAGIRLAAKQDQGVDTAKLEALSTELTELCREHPDRNDIGRRLQAVIATHLKQPDETEEELKRAIEESSESLGAEIQLVGHYRQAGQMTEAIKTCQRACERHAEVARPWIVLSGLHTENEDYDAARSCLEQGLSNVVGSEKRSLSLGLASLDLMQGNRTTAIHRLRKLADEDQKEVRARELLLRIHEIGGDRAEAEKLVEELKEAEGESGLLWRFHQALLWLLSDDWRSKQRDIAEQAQYCIDADPQWLPPVLLLVRMYERLEDFRKVEDICRQTLTQNPLATAIADRLLILLERQGRFSDTEQVLKDLQQTNADPRLTSVWQVRTALRAGDVSEAINELKLRVSIDDQDASSRIQLARLIYYQTKDVNLASRYLREAEAITPGSRTLTAARVSILRAEGQTEEAQRILDDYVANHNDFNAYWMRAVYLAEEGEFERAEKDYKKLMTFTERGAAGCELLGNFYANNKELDRAVATLEEGLKAYPENLRIKRRLMEALFMRANTQDQERALEILTTLEDRLPEDPELIKLRVIQSLQEPTPQSLKAAKEKLETVIRLTPTAVDAHLVLISIAMQERKYETARDFAIRALGSNPNNSALLSARGMAELALENTQMAVQLAQLVLQKDPNNISAIVIHANVYRLSGDMTLSEQWIERAERLDPNNLIVFESRCQWLGVQKRFEELAKVSSAFLSTKEQDLRKVLMIASILSASDSIRFKREAAKLFEHALTLSPASLEAGWGLASTLYNMGDLERAKTLYQKFLEQHPDNIQVLNDFAWILQEHEHRYEAALELANRGLSLAPNNLHLLDTRGTILAKMTDRLADAKKDFEKLVELSPTDSPRRAKTLLKLGRVCSRLNDHDRARECLEKASEIDQKINVFTTDERSEIMRIVQQRGI
ncbi:tetratricopeptide repeat protein [Planctomycetota bacterium]